MSGELTKAKQELELVSEENLAKLMTETKDQDIRKMARVCQLTQAKKSMARAAVASNIFDKVLDKIDEKLSDPDNKLSMKDLTQAGMLADTVINKVTPTLETIEGSASAQMIINQVNVNVNTDAKKFSPVQRERMRDIIDLISKVKNEPKDDEKQYNMNSGEYTVVEETTTQPTETQEQPKQEPVQEVNSQPINNENKYLKGDDE